MLISYGPFVIIHALCIFGVAWTISGVELFVAVPLASMLAIIGALPFLVIKRTRPRAMSTLIVAGSIFVLFIPTLYVANGLRTLGFYLAAKRAAPLIAAIEAHVRDAGDPPKSLEELVPRYLPAIPSRLPEFDIIAGDTARQRYEGNDWVLEAMVPTGVINWDLFLYFPNQRYPDIGYGGWLQRIERWAYVHE